MRPSSKISSSCTTDDELVLRKGPWSGEEDEVLIHYISSHGEGRWNLLARKSGLRRTGKSCRLRWLNYLKPDVKRGNLTPQEQLLILELHLMWGNRWSKIAQLLPGRTDNEIKNFWRSRVQKQAKILKIDPNSAEFQDLVRNSWVPRLTQKLHIQTPETLSRASSQIPSVISVYKQPHNILQETPASSSLESSTSCSLNSAESMYFPHLPPFPECPSDPLHVIDDNGYNMEAFSSPPFVGPEDLNDFIDYDQIGEGNNSLIDGLNVDSLWSTEY